MQTIHISRPRAVAGQITDGAGVCADPAASRVRSRVAGKLATTRITARYCGAAFGTAVMVLAAAAGVNAVIDPFDMYRLREFDGINMAKPAVYNRVRLFKAFEVRRFRPRAVVLGSSRAHVGFRCSHEAWAMVDGPCYNLAFDGATSPEMHAYLRHAHAVRPLSQVVLALDTYHLAGGPGFTRPDFDPLLLFDRNHPRLLRFLTADLRLLTSFDTLRASVDTVQRQSAIAPRWFAPDGQRLGEVFFREIDSTFREVGPRGYFNEVDRAEVRYQTEGLKPRSESMGSGPPPDPEQSSLSFIRRMVEFCITEGIALRIVITPAHAHQYEIASAVGAWASMQDGKRRLVNVLAELAVAHPKSQPVALWDFSGYSSVTTEPLPPSEGRDEMRFYWDSSHFKGEVGDYVLDRIFGVSSPGRSVPADFGTLLTRETIDQALADQGLGQNAYRQRHLEETQHLESMVVRAIRRAAF
jgi:hypothetical protein